MALSRLDVRRCASVANLADGQFDRCSLTDFISHSYAPLKGALGASGTGSVLAFSTLLLHIQGWNLSLAISDFAKIAAVAGHSNQDLGNLMGLTSTHSTSDRSLAI